MDVSNVLPTLKYIWLTIKHKAFVFRAGLRTKAPLWRLIIHDWSKFMPSEAPHYGRSFFGDRSDSAGFQAAWLKHQNRHPHHWEYWISRSPHIRTEADSKFIPMPEWAVREMVADWLGASRAYGGKWPTSRKDWEWYNNSFIRIFENCHPETRKLIDAVIDEVLPNA